MAGTTEDKLQVLENTKAGLKTAINATGHTVGDVFSAYPAAVTAYKNEVDDGYAQIAAAITDKGVPTEATDTPAQMATNIGQIETGGGNVTGTLNQVSFVSGLTIIWSDGENGYVEYITDPHDAIYVMKNSCIYVKDNLQAYNISGGISEIQPGGGSPLGSAKVYFVYDDFTLNY